MSLISLALLTSRAGTLNVPLPCQREDPELWFSEQPADLEQAKAHCRRCPVRGFCLTGAVERRFAKQMRTERAVDGDGPDVG